MGAGRPVCRGTAADGAQLLGACPALPPVRLLCKARRRLLGPQGRVGRGGLGEAAGVAGEGEEEGGHHLLLGAGRRDEAVARTGDPPGASMPGELLCTGTLLCGPYGSDDSPYRRPCVCVPVRSAACLQCQSLAAHLLVPAEIVRRPGDAENTLRLLLHQLRLLRVPPAVAAEKDLVVAAGKVHLELLEQYRRLYLKARALSLAQVGIQPGAVA